MGGVVLAVDIALKKLNAWKPFDMGPVAGLLLLFFALVQVFPAADFYYAQKGVRGLARTIEHYAPLVRRLPPDYVVVSNVPDIVGYFSRRNVRVLDTYSPYTLAKLLGKERRFAVFVVKDGLFFGRSAWYPQLSWTHPGYRTLFNDENVALFALP